MTLYTRFSSFSLSFIYVAANPNPSKYPYLPSSLSLSLFFFFFSIFLLCIVVLQRKLNGQCRPLQSPHGGRGFPGLQGPQNWHDQSPHHWSFSIILFSVFKF